MPGRGKNVILREYKETETHTVPRSLVANPPDTSHKINGEILFDSFCLKIVNIF
jgi:hypothetical protein